MSPCSQLRVGWQQRHQQLLCNTPAQGTGPKQSWACSRPCSTSVPAPRGEVHSGSWVSIRSHHSAPPYSQP